jgi:hypothetical protein
MNRHSAIVVALTRLLLLISLATVNTGCTSNDDAAAAFFAEQQQHARQVHDAALALTQALSRGEAFEAPMESLRTAAKTYDFELQNLLRNAVISDKEGRAQVQPKLKTEAGKKLLGDARRIWTDYAAHLDPVLRFSGSPYESGRAEVSLNGRGKRLQVSLTELNEFGVTAYPQLATISKGLAAEIE